MLQQLFVYYAAGAPPSCNNSFFGLIPWWGYLPSSDFSGCDIKTFHFWGSSSDILLVLMAIVDDLLRIAGIVAVGFIIYAAINFITSQGNPEDAAKARGVAINALIGLVISMVAVVLVSYIGRTLGG